jgi:hypothetical protein
MDKAYILGEIVRTAREAGGVAPGKRKFEQETGIREHDWLGKHWARWSDAVKEAGLQPNQLAPRIDDDRLLVQVAMLARDLGHVPIHPEMRMRARAVKGFPSTKTLARFGSKPELDAKVFDFCTRDAEFADVAAIYASSLAIGTGQQATSVEPLDASIPIGHVYLLKSGRYYKIGRSNAAGRRERELAIQLPEKANTVHVIRTDDPPGIEAYWHRRFEARRLNGEWFDLTAADVQAFKRRKFM